MARIETTTLLLISYSDDPTDDLRLLKEHAEKIGLMTSTPNPQVVVVTNADRDLIDAFYERTLEQRDADDEPAFCGIRARYAFDDTKMSPEEAECGIVYRMTVQAMRELSAVEAALVFSTLTNLSKLEH